MTWLTRFWKKLGIHKPKRFWIHVPVCMVAPLLILADPNPIIGVSYFWGYLFLFAVYEIIEDWRCHDLGYTDVQGGIAGVAAGSVIVYLIKLVEKLLEG